MKLKSPGTTVTGPNIGEQSLGVCTCHYLETDVVVRIEEPLYFVLCVDKQMYFYDISSFYCVKYIVAF